MITNIFKNDFYRRPPTPKWSWELSILANSSEVWSEEKMKIFTQAITKVDIPELTMQTTQSQYRGLTFDVPTRLENDGEISLTFNENSNMELYKALKNQLYYTSYNADYINDEWSETNDNNEFIDDYMLYYAPFDVYVSLRNPENDNERTYHFFFRNCFISSIGEAEMTYDSEEAFEFTVKIHYNFRVEGLDAEEYYSKVKNDAEEKKVEIASAPNDTADTETGMTESPTEDTVEKDSPIDTIQSTAETISIEQSVKSELTTESTPIAFKTPETTEEESSKPTTDFGTSAKIDAKDDADTEIIFGTPVEVKATDEIAEMKSGIDAKWSKSLAQDDESMFANDTDFKLPDLEDLDEDEEISSTTEIILDEQVIKADDDGNKKSGIDKQWHDSLAQEDAKLFKNDESNTALPDTIETDEINGVSKISQIEQENNLGTVI